MSNLKHNGERFKYEGQFLKNSGSDTASIILSQDDTFLFLSIVDCLNKSKSQIIRLHIG